jgi:ribonuclease Z
LGIKEVINLQLRHSKSHIKFDLIFHELNSKKSELIFEDEKVKIKTIPLHHRVYTNGFLFMEKEKPRKLDIKAIKEVEEIETCDYNNLKAGKDFVLKSNEVIQNSLLTLDPEPSLSYAFCSDTSYKPDIIEIIKEAHLLYHEATFLSDKKDLAKKTRHSTAEQAALIAKKANVKKLIIGHYSSRYKDISLFKKEAEKVFSNVILAETGKVISMT